MLSRDAAESLIAARLKARAPQEARKPGSDSYAKMMDNFVFARWNHPDARRVSLEFATLVLDWSAQDADWADKAWALAAPALMDRWAFEMEKGRKIVDRAGVAGIPREGGTFRVPGSTGSYRVTLDPRECSCPSFEKLEYLGLWCKHVAAVDQIQGG